MATATAGLRGRIDRSPTTLGFVVGDLLLIGAFLFAGTLQHDTAASEQVSAFAGVAAPFYVGWLLLFPLAGVYAARTRQSPRTAVTRVVGAWVGAALVGLALRATAFFPGGFAVAFMLVAIGVGLALLVPFHLLPFVPRAVRRFRSSSD
ncbi:DUF3054 domain-containing protein [Halomarina oriensis]|uniref:DUF3054 family protein n=1 Tax=Halomarina oriensis TaxID=671145 RepID=A0A6B0GG90_9EURY|nr:DUF3054 domain-containing protein [Halomarina oriensis]MWG33530.1 DUF3054 family protein [Halomarina oriensis]